MASDEVLVQRLVHLVDEGKRNELMIIYLEGLRPLGLTTADFKAGGRGAARCTEISQELLERAQKGMNVIR